MADIEQRQQSAFDHEFGQPGPDTKTVVFHWSTEYGDCYDCGLPAAFYVGANPSPENNRCSVCAGNAAADGEFVHRIKDWPHETEYTVTLANSYDAESPEDAVRSMVAYALDEAMHAGYRVAWRDDAGNKQSTFIDADDLG